MYQKNDISFHNPCSGKCNFLDYTYITVTLKYSERTDWQNMLVTKTQISTRTHTLTFLSDPEQQTDQQCDREEPLGWEDAWVPHPHSSSLLGKPFWSVLIALISLLHCGVMTFIAKAWRVIRYNPIVSVIISGHYCQGMFKHLLIVTQRAIV